MTDRLTTPHEYLTVKELAEVLRLKERKVYDLAASGALPCSRATGKLLFRSDEIRAWIDGAKSGGYVARKTRPAIMLGSHDPLLDWALRQSRCGLASFFDGSQDGLDRFAAAEGVAAGLHVHDPVTESWNVGAAKRAASEQNAVLIAFARRSRGLVYRSDRPAIGTLRALTDLTIVPRQPGSGTHGLFAHLTAKDGVDPSQLCYAATARTEDDAVAAVQRGEADVAFGLKAVAQSHGCGFTPVIQEEFALLVDRAAWFSDPFQQLLTFCQGPEFQEHAEKLRGYDITDFGRVLWNA